MYKQFVRNLIFDLELQQLESRKFGVDKPVHSVFTQSYKLKYQYD